MRVLVIEPNKEPCEKEITGDLASLQAEVGGYIQAVYPFSDPVALICNEEGKINGLDLNRGLRETTGEVYDIIAGTFLVVGLSEDNFDSLSDELCEKYRQLFRVPECFVQIGRRLFAIPAY